MAATDKRTKRGSARLRAGRALAALALGLSVPACYTYTPVSPAAVAPGSSVRLRTAAGASPTMGSLPLPQGGRVIEGTVLPGSSPDTLVCAVPLGDGEPLAWSRGLRRTMLVPVAGVDRLEVRHLQKGRTAAVVATGAVLGLVVLRWAFNVSLPSVQGRGDPGGGNNMRGAVLPLRR